VKEVKGRSPSKAVLELMGWTIFITNLREEVSFEVLLEIYGLRWRIEVIFKAWKSNMSFFTGSVLWNSESILRLNSS